ncbi:TPA: hypothetical protein ACXNHL_002692 [Serratia marcescens]
MSIEEVTFDCKEVRIEAVRYDLVRVIADRVDIEDVMGSIKRHGDTDEALDCIGEEAVIKWIEKQGYVVTEEE